MTASARLRSRPRSIACGRSAISCQFGSASGQIDAFNINILQAKGSLFATRPTLNHYAAKREDLHEHRQGPVRGGRLRRGQNSGQPDLQAQGRAEGAQGSGRPRHHRRVDPGSVSRRMRIAVPAVLLIAGTAVPATGAGEGERRGAPWRSCASTASPAMPRSRRIRPSSSRRKMSRWRRSAQLKQHARFGLPADRAGPRNAARQRAAMTEAESAALGRWIKA